MRTIVFAILLLSISFATQAGSGVKRETVEQLLHVMNAEKMIDSMYSQMDNMFVDLAQQLGVNESERPIFDRFMSKMAHVMKEEMTWAKMKEPIIDIYLKHYTEKEIKDLLAFYSTDSGKAMINKMPVVMQESMLITQSMMKDFMPKIKELSEEMRDELAATRTKSQSDQEQMEGQDNK